MSRISFDCVSSPDDSNELVYTYEVFIELPNGEIRPMGSFTCVNKQIVREIEKDLERSNWERNWEDHWPQMERSER